MNINNFETMNTVLTVDQHLPTICTEIFIIGKCSPHWTHDFIMLDLHRFDVQIKNLFFLRNITFLSSQYKFAVDLVVPLNYSSPPPPYAL